MQQPLWEAPQSSTQNSSLCKWPQIIPHPPPPHKYAQELKTPQNAFVALHRKDVLRFPYSKKCFLWKQLLSCNKQKNWFVVIVRVKVVFRKTVVGDITDTLGFKPFTKQKNASRKTAAVYLRELLFRWQAKKQQHIFCIYKSSPVIQSVTLTWSW